MGFSMYSYGGDDLKGYLTGGMNAEVNFTLEIWVLEED